MGQKLKIGKCFNAKMLVKTKQTKFVDAIKMVLRGYFYTSKCID